MTRALTATRHVLPFAELSPADFERLVYWLLIADTYQDLQHVGAAGTEDGVDIVARRGGERIYIQCKRVGVFGPGAFEGAIEKVGRAVAAGRWEKPDRLLFAVTVEPSAEARRRCAAAEARVGFAIDFLTLHELDRRAKQQPEALLEFFQIADDAPRNTPVDSMRPPPPTFVNRENEHRRLTRSWEQAAAAGRSALILIHGVGGVGKSALARAWAYRHRDHLRGGLFQVEITHLLDGAADISRGVSEVLADLGISRSAQPADFSDKVREYRRLVDRQPIALLIRGARTEAEIAPFVPSSAGSVVLITSRERIDSLVAFGADSIDTGPLGAGSAAELVAAVVGAERANGVAVEELVDFCGGLPLFLTTCASWFVGRSASSADRLLTRLRNGDPALRAGLPFHVLDQSYLDLDRGLQLAYRRLVGGPVVDLTTFAVASSLGVGIGEAEDTCEALEARGLIERTGGATWVAHDLLREHARGQASEPRAKEDGALRELARRYAWAASRADALIVSDRPRLGLRARVPEPDIAGAPVSIETAHAWWLRERMNALSVAQICAERGWHAELMLLAEGSWPMAVTLKTVAEWIGIQRLAADAAALIHDDRADARFRSQLARALADGGDALGAAAEIAAAQEAAVRSGDQLLMASVTEFGGICLLEAGDPGEALKAFEEARFGFARLRVPRGVALQDYYSSRALLALGRPLEALAKSESAYDALVMAGDEISVTRSQLRQAEALIALTEFDAAAEVAERALATASANGHWFESAQAHEALALSNLESSELRAAHQAAAREMYRRIGHPRGLGY